MRDIELDRASGWKLLAAWDGENWSLHVENEFNQGASLTCAINEHEVMGPENELHKISSRTLSAFTLWDANHAGWLMIAEAKANLIGRAG